jgi:hypothetical protein
VGIGARRSKCRVIACCPSAKGPGYLAGRRAFVDAATLVAKNDIETVEFDHIAPIFSPLGSAASRVRRHLWVCADVSANAYPGGVE